jgi:hypothetical protein
MQCAVCGAEAEDLKRGDFDGVIVGCKRCGEYEVGDSVLNDFLRLDYDARVAALDKAKGQVSSGARPAITVAML